MSSVKSFVLGVTGHRPNKLGGYSTPNPIYNFVVSETEKFLLKHKPSKIITGMCIGYDQWVAELAIKLQIPFVAAIPFIGQESLWPSAAQNHYKDLLAQAEHIEIVNKGGFASWKLHARNRWIVDHSSVVLAAYNDVSHSGGTYNCLTYAKEKNRSITIINHLEADKITHVNLNS